MTQSCVSTPTTGIGADGDLSPGLGLCGFIYTKQSVIKVYVKFTTLLKNANQILDVFCLASILFHEWENIPNFSSSKGMFDSRWLLRMRKQEEAFDETAKTRYLYVSDPYRRAWRLRRRRRQQ
ncbi:MAG: hypothetical protein KZQ76_14910 [Candidatus Thiodiazotropha sp. (ex Epidulcina cf. delphinae)]|nr:hypothetical protein [Candidatus Thiodiazotropha sp. (ex Epidulcina cf. delphinae)]